MNPNTYIFPAHWVFNAGMLGLLEVLKNKAEIDPLKSSILLQNGAIDGGKLYKIVRSALREDAKVPPELQGLKKLHWWCIEYLYDNLLKDKGEEDNMSPENQTGQRRSSKKKKKAKPKDFKSREEKIYFRVMGKMFGKGGDYTNLFNPSHFKSIDMFLDKFGYCKIFCSLDSETAICPLSGLQGFELTAVELRWLTSLFPSYTHSPNSFRGMTEKGALRIANPALYVMLLHSIMMKKVYEHRHEDGSREEVYAFVNTPSFLTAYYLNLLLKEVSGNEKSYHELLAISLLKYAVRVQRLLSAWVRQNIELVLKRVIREEGNSYPKIIVEVVSLPEDISALLLDNKIANLLYSIESPHVLSMVLRRDLGSIENLAYMQLRKGISLKRDRGRDTEAETSNPKGGRRNRKASKGLYGSKATDDLEEAFQLIQLATYIREHYKTTTYGYGESR